MRIVREAVRAAAAERMDRAALNLAGVERGATAAVDSVVCIETHKEEQTFPWVIGLVKEPVHTSTSASAPFDLQAEGVHLEPVRSNEPVLKVQLYEGLGAGSTTYFLSDIVVLVPTRRVRVIDVSLEELRRGPRTGSRQRVRVQDASLNAIRAEMPTSSDDWEVCSM